MRKRRTTSGFPTGSPGQYTHARRCPQGCRLRRGHPLAPSACPPRARAPFRNARGPTWLASAPIALRGEALALSRAVPAGSSARRAQPALGRDAGRVPAGRGAGRAPARARAGARTLKNGSARARLPRRARATRLGPAQAPGPGPGLNPAHWHAPRPIFGDAFQGPHLPNLQVRYARMPPTEGRCHLAASIPRSAAATTKQMASQAVRFDPKSHT